MFRLRFRPSEIRKLVKMYDEELGSKDRGRTDKLVREVFPAYRRRGYLTRGEFLDVCDWKTRRTRASCRKNSAEFIRDITWLVRRTRSERLRIEALTLLEGVSWPTASVFLHFAFPRRYPILDYRALWSLRCQVPNAYDFGFWKRYVRFCRGRARRHKVTLRALDKALWKYSQLQQRPRKKGQERAR